MANVNIKVDKTRDDGNGGWWKGSGNVASRIGTNVTSSMFLCALIITAVNTFCLSAILSFRNVCLFVKCFDILRNLILLLAASKL